MRSIPAGTASCSTALACATQAAAQRAEMPPINPAAAARASLARAAATATPAVTAAPKAALVQIVDDEAHGAYKEGV
jgi:hypothetical protein